MAFTVVFICQQIRGSQFQQYPEQRRRGQVKQPAIKPEGHHEDQRTRAASRLDSGFGIGSLEFIHSAFRAPHSGLAKAQPHIRYKAQQPRQAQLRAQHEITVHGQGRRAAFRGRIAFVIHAYGLIPAHTQRMTDAVVALVLETSYFQRVLWPAGGVWVSV